MRSSRIFLNDSLAKGQMVELDKPQTHYLTSVLRLKSGDPLTLFNGKGGEYSATIKTLDKRHAIVELLEFSDINVESPVSIALGQGVARGERMDWILQKSVELGVGHITPLFTQRTNVKIPADRRASRLKHWQGVITSACEQSGRNSVPTIAAPKSILDWLQTVDAELKLVLHHRASISLSNLSGKPKSIALFVGPEGGLTEEEIAMAEQCGFQSVKLGPRVLRTETASLTAIAALQMVFGDF
jgi:16S rRNA (uracil1498-N3)-methyltransferase